LETASFSIPPPDALKDQTVEQLAQLSQEVADYLFTEQPDAKRVGAAVAAFLRSLVERDPALGYTFVTTCMKKYTTPDGECFDEEHEKYLSELSMALHNISDYQRAFTVIAEAMANGLK
jgi:hypothetical protein